MVYWTWKMKKHSIMSFFSIIWPGPNCVFSLLVLPPVAFVFTHSWAHKEIIEQSWLFPVFSVLPDLCNCSEIHSFTVVFLPFRFRSALKNRFTAYRLKFTGERKKGHSGTVMLVFSQCDLKITISCDFGSELIKRKDCSHSLSCVTCGNESLIL